MLLQLRYLICSLGLSLALSGCNQVILSFVPLPTPISTPTLLVKQKTSWVESDQLPLKSFAQSVPLVSALCQDNPKECLTPSATPTPIPPTNTPALIALSLAPIPLTPTATPLPTITPTAIPVTAVPPSPSPSPTELPLAPSQQPTIVDDYGPRGTPSKELSAERHTGVLLGWDKPAPTKLDDHLPRLAGAETLTYTFPVIANKVQYGPEHHDYPATDIFCPMGSEFVAPTAGTVEFVSWEDNWDPKIDSPYTRGGLAVRIIGQDGLYYYGAHLSKIAEGIKPGGKVAAGDLLGFTGRTGNARFTPPHLHFDIWSPAIAPTADLATGQIPPYPYLKAWEEGQPLSPKLKE